MHNRRITSRSRPTERSTPAVAALRESVYVFGGVKDDFSTFQNTFYNDLYRFDTSTDTWFLLSPKGSLPPARAFAASVAAEDRALGVRSKNQCLDGTSAKWYARYTATAT
ncbi:kelch repeat-containing protein [Iningainema tapete]|uniref:Kelch repeat protein n=1 Tax=Iningainema tapete BLCC-T55 TaxID=2748662 RepID=A0A8J7C9X5_9CYAN|nr:hypothetical protein [Iningainema tapete BLCC-T55]